MNAIYHYLSDDRIDLYEEKRGILYFGERFKLADIDVRNVRNVVLAPQYYVCASISELRLSFTPDKGQFLFAEKSLIPIDELDFLPATFDETRRIWEQVWASSPKMWDMRRKFPNAVRLYPEQICMFKEDFDKVDVSDELSAQNRTATQFNSSAAFFQGVKKPALVGRDFLGPALAVLFAITPWLVTPKLPFFESDSQAMSFQNSVGTLDDFGDLEGALLFLDLEVLEFNLTQQSTLLTFKSEFSTRHQVLKSVERFCVDLGCVADVRDKELVLNWSQQ